MYAWAQLVSARSDFTSQTSIRYNSIFFLASHQIQAIQSQKTRLEPRPHVKYLHSQKWLRAEWQWFSLVRKFAKIFKLFFAAALPTCQKIPLLRKGKLLSTPQRRVSLRERTNKLLDLRTIGGIRDRPPVCQKPAQMTRVPVTKATLVDPLASATPKRQSLKKAVHPSSKHKNDDEYTRFETPDSRHGGLLEWQIHALCGRQGHPGISSWSNPLPRLDKVITWARYLTLRISHFVRKVTAPFLKHKLGSLIGSVFTETFSSDWGLDDKNRFERCLLYCASKQSTSTPFAFHAWRPAVPIFLPPLWVRTCRSPFYEALEACCCPIKESRSKTDHLSWQHYCLQSDSGGHCEGQGLNPLAAPASRLNWKKTVLHPARSMEYLGFVISSIEIKLFLPQGKMSQLVQDCKDLILARSASVRTLSQIIGKLTSTMQAVLPAPLHYRHLQMLQVKGLLEGKEYDSVVPLNMECRNDLLWWIDQLSIWNGRSLISPAPDLIITTDASLKGWGLCVREFIPGDFGPRRNPYCI